MNAPDFTKNGLIFFLLIFFRMSGIVMFAPIFGSEGIPPQVKIFFSFILAMLLAPLVSHGGVHVVDNVGWYLTAVLMEFSVGAIIGFSASIIFSAVQFGGQLIGQEMGISMAEVIDPISNRQTSIVGQFKLVVATMIYLAIDGHHYVIQAASASFKSVPMLGLNFSDKVALRIADTAISDMFVGAIKIAAPALVTLFMVTIVMAFLARIVPEMNIFILGFSIRIVIGFLIMIFALPLFGELVQRLNKSSEGLIADVLRLMGG